MTRKRWLVVSVGQECLDDLGPCGLEQQNRHGESVSGEALWRIRLRAPAGSPAELGREPTYVLYVSQAQDKGAPYGVGGAADLDERLLTQEDGSG